MIEVENKKIKKNIIYNSIGTFVYLFCQWLITFIAVWFSGYDNAGLLSLAMSVTATYIIFANFNMRNFQSSDYNACYSEKTYLYSRLVTCLLSLGLITIYCCLSHFTFYQFICIICYMVFKISEAIVDVLHGSLQRKWRFDIISLSYFIRGLISVSLFSITLLLSKNLLYSIITMAIGVYLFIYFYDIKKYKSVFQKRGQTSFLKVFQLLLQCIPLVIYGFLLNYYTMYPRVVANELFGTRILGFYASVATPAIIVQAAASFIFTPLITLFSEYYNEKKYKELFKTIIRVVIITIIIGCLILLMSTLLCDFMFGLLFGKEILKYTYLFNGVIIVSTLTALVWLLAIILTVTREYFRLVLCTIISLIVNYIFTNYFLHHYYLNGINYILIISYTVHIFLLLICVLRIKKRTIKNEKSIYYISNNNLVDKNIIDTLLKNDYDIHLITSKNIDTTLKVTKSNCPFKNKILSCIWLFLKLIKNNRKYTCIQVSSTESSFTIFIVAILCNKKIIYDIKDKKINKLDQAIINYADLIIIHEQEEVSFKEKLLLSNNSPNKIILEKYNSVLNNNQNGRKVLVK